MEQFQQIGRVLGSLKALMVFRDDIQINRWQCCFLVDIFSVAFETIAEEIKRNLRFEERHTKWKALEHPLKDLYRIFKEAEIYLNQCLDTKDWWAKAISLSKNADCVEFHVHNLLSCVPVVIEAIEIAGEIAGCDVDEMQMKRLLLTKKYDREWRDSKIFQWKFGKQYLVSQDICNKMKMVWKEDRWALLRTIKEKLSSDSTSLTKQEQRLAEVLLSNLNEAESKSGKLFPNSVLTGSKDYQVRRRLGNGRQYKEIQWLGESFVVRHFFGEVEHVIPEISLLSSLVHPNVLHFLCGFSDEEKKECFLVMELMNKDLCSYIKETCSPKRRIPFSLPVAVDIMLQIARGMEYLHSRKIYHGDLNPSSILVKTRSASSEGYLHAKVSGFNLQHFNTHSSPYQNGTQAPAFIWYAPEVLTEQEKPGDTCSFKRSEKADVYSFGMICFELLTGKVPFEDGHLQGDKMSRNIRTGERPLFPFSSPKYLVNLTKRCWQTDPIQRPSFSSISRILRYVKRFLVMNPDHSQPNAPSTLVDYCEVEARLSKNIAGWGSSDSMPVSQIPFQMFAYKVSEKEKTCVNVKEKSSDSGSDGLPSACGDENSFVVDDTFLPSIEKKSIRSESNYKRTPVTKKTMEGKTITKTGSLKGRAARRSQLISCGRSLRTKSETHASESELA